MSKVHDRILELTVATDDSAETLACTAVNYYRDRAQLDAANPLAIVFTGGSAAVTPVEITLGELVPPPTHIRFVFTAVP